MRFTTRAGTCAHPHKGQDDMTSNEKLAEDAWNMSRPNGDRFWVEIPMPAQDRLVVFCKAITALRTQPDAQPDSDHIAGGGKMIPDAQPDVVEALRGFVDDLTSNGSNPYKSLTIDHAALNSRIKQANAALASSEARDMVDLMPGPAEYTKAVSEARETQPRADDGVECIGCGEDISARPYMVDDNGETGCPALFSTGGKGACWSKSAQLSRKVDCLKEAMQIRDKVAVEYFIQDIEAFAATLTGDTQ